ncbi:MAG: excinuclease ABC subunit UvrC [Myxococcales bacterium]|jgi:excinuclease ABC subunit C|nr:excinuclease ABC subunit UvrC [Myxococcales bacterium]
MLPAVVEEKLSCLPVQPGVYIFKDKKGAVLYVGKAKSLRSRVRSYFQPGVSDTRSFIPLLLETIGDLDTVVVQTEKEAAILENSLIKEHHPRYNVKLRDDKEYLSLRLPALGTSGGDAWPRLYLVRRPTTDGARYFGPYHSATAARRTLHLINKHFQLRTCSDAELARRKRPCLQYQIKRCPAPCVYDVDRGWYAEQVDAVAKFLEGRHRELSRELDAKMKDAARATAFELAAVYRDQLAALEKVREEQRVVAVDDVDRDVIGLYRDGDLVEVAVLFVRAGKLADVTTFSLRGVEIPDEEVVSAFLAQRYGDHGAEGEVVPVPDEIVVPELPEAESGIREWLAERAGHAVTIVRPERGRRHKLLEMAVENAKHSFDEKRRAKDDVDVRLGRIQERLRLPTLPRRIECTDISHLGGGDTVGSVVAFTDGEPDKKRYRTYHVRGVGGPAPAASEVVSGDDPPSRAHAGDDYAAMYEVLSRRFRRGVAARAGEGAGEEGPEWDLPDLFVVDGGRGQLGVALAAARDLGLHDLPIVGLAKEKENVLGETLVDRVYLPGQKNPVPVRGPLVILARARDEAHRFANKGREKKGKERRMRSQLDDVKGLGPTAKKALLRQIGSLAAIREATDEDLLAVPGVRPQHVRALRRVFPRSGSGSPEPEPEAG